MPFDVKKWLKDDLGFSDEEITAVAEKLEPKADALEKGYLRQSDYSKKMNDLQKAQGDLTTANDRLNHEMAEWAELQASGQEVTQKMRDDLEKSQAKVLQLEQRVKRVATDAGLDPAKALEGIDVVVKKDDPPPAPPVDLTGYAKADQVASVAQLALTLPATLLALAHEHQQLTGETLDAQRLVSELQSRAGTKGNQKSLDPRVIWEELHEIPAKREAKSKTTYDAAIAAAEQRGREAALSEAALPGGTTPVGRHAPVFQTAQGREGSVLKRPAPGTTVTTAAAALRSGKYRTQGAAAKTT